MKTFSLLEPASEEFVALALKKMGREITDAGHASHPQEDFFSSSTKEPIFAVADGVTLIQYIIDKEKGYPNPSPAGDVARIFCESVVRKAEELYEGFGLSSLVAVFREANASVEKYNRDNGRTKDTIDYWDRDLYAATGAFMIAKEKKVYWASICDSFVFHFKKDGSLAFKSPEPNSFATAQPPEFQGDKSDQKARARYAWSVRRNGVNQNGEPVGYGVITGEPAAEKYLGQGSFDLDEGELAIIATDGFEEYFKLPEFISLLQSWPSDLESRVKEFARSKALEDPDKYGHERSFTVIML